MKPVELEPGLRSMGLPIGINEVEIDRLTVLAELVESIAIPRGFIGEGERDRLIPRHILESAGLVHFLKLDGTTVDIGSGAGLPGLVLACLLPEPVVLVESLAKRAAFLRRAVHELGLDVEVMHGRAEDLVHGGLRETFVNATARALASPPIALELTLPYVRVGGSVVLPGGGGGREGASATGSRAAEEAHSSPDVRADLGRAAETLGGGSPEVRGFAVPGLEEARWVTIVSKLRGTPDLYPRTAGAIRRRPLGGGVA